MHAFEEQEFDQGRFYMHCPKRSDHKLCKVRLVFRRVQVGTICRDLAISPIVLLIFVATKLMCLPGQIFIN